VAIALSAIPIAIVANAARVAGTGLTSHWIGEDAARGFFHTFSGWFMFVVALVALAAVQRILSRLPIPAARVPVEAPCLPGR
jgi:exosortase/archaeosortase family protein